MSIPSVNHLNGLSKAEVSTHEVTVQGVPEAKVSSLCLTPPQHLNGLVKIEQRCQIFFLKCNTSNDNFDIVCGNQ